jgi:membrane protein DedA with SNARE-associated domain
MGLHRLVESLVRWYSSALDSWGYWLIALLMAIESSVFPLPSEVVIPPAAHIAHTTGKFSMVWIVVAGAVGSWIGAAIMYWVSRLAGRPFVLRYGKYFFISEHKIHGAERWARRFGSFGIFASRLLPVVRHLIGIPAGIVRMDFKAYSLYTLAGSTVWCAVLCWLGVKLGGQINAGEMHKLTYWLLGFLAVMGLIYYFLVHRYMKESASAESEPDPAAISEANPRSKDQGRG